MGDQVKKLILRVETYAAAPAWNNNEMAAWQWTRYVTIGLSNGRMLLFKLRVLEKKNKGLTKVDDNNPRRVSERPGAGLSFKKETNVSKIFSKCQYESYSSFTAFLCAPA